MEQVSSFTSTSDRVVRAVTTTVAGGYLVNSRGAPSSAPDEGVAGKVDHMRGEVTTEALQSARTVERVLSQLGERPDRIVRSRGGGIAFLFLARGRYAMLECDDEGVTIALLSDRSTDSEAETWIVAPGELTSAVRRIRSFVGASHGSHP